MEVTAAPRGTACIINTNHSVVRDDTYHARLRSRARDILDMYARGLRLLLRSFLDLVRYRFRRLFVYGRRDLAHFGYRFTSRRERFAAGSGRAQGLVGSRIRFGLGFRRGLRLLLTNMFPRRRNQLVRAFLADSLDIEGGLVSFGELLR